MRELNFIRTGHLEWRESQEPVLAGADRRDRAAVRRQPLRRRRSADPSAGLPRACSPA